MATQGIVSVVSNDHVLMKIVAGSDGQQGNVVARRLEEMWPCTPQEAYDLALAENFGTPDTLVVITESEIVCDKKECGDIPPLYRETFQDPLYNHRWKCGFAAHIRVVHV